MNAASLAESALRWLLTYSIHSALLCVAGLFFARLVLAPGARLNLVLKVALFGALLSASLPWKAVSPWEVLGRGASVTSTQVGWNGVRPVASDQIQNEETSSLIASSSGAAQGTPVNSARAHVSAGVGTWLGWTGALLALGAVLLLGRMTLLKRRFVNSLERVPSRDDEAAALLEYWAAEDRRAQVLLTESTRLASPVVLSLGEICVPEACWRTLSAEERAALLAHEYAHIQRRDPLWFSAAAILERAFFFLPWHRLLRRSHNASAEIACDALAAKRVGSPAAVARCLATVASWGAEPNDLPPVPALVPAMSASRSALVSRVNHLLNGEDRPVSRGFEVWVTASLLGFVCCTPSVTRSDGRAPTAQAAAHESAIRFEVEADGMVTGTRSGDFPPLEPIRGVFQGREGKAAFHDWLRAAAVDLPTMTQEDITAWGSTAPANMGIHAGKLTIAAGRDVELKYGLQLMAQAGAVAVQMPDLELEVDGIRYSTPLPFDRPIVEPDADPRLYQRIDIRIDAAADGSSTSYRFSFDFGSTGFQVLTEDDIAGDIEPASPKVYPASTLEQLRSQLEAQLVAGSRPYLTIDGRKGVRFGTIADLLAMLEELGIDQFTFKGSYEA